ncbi:PREDICTED: cytochrome c oxidase copper chaperone 2-like [Tarenaya hassleriana]|uniref:cytochrome c oxidase copper chaperone 2-like n=1 Tax=Tarenaya hassleriana TaxID=28532 RepID=UPI00053C184E|nr:PREDICTED: cytochrome c oxidase copper chaperone 2-like [Tarenaya hassleriana]
MSGQTAENDVCSSAQTGPEPTNMVVEAETKPKKRICCACPETKKVRDECIVEHGESACTKWIEAHRMCLRAEGFNV